MRFSTLLATLVLPLSALAAPFLVRRSNASFDQLKNGITAAQGAFEKLYLEAITPPRQDALATATTSGRSALAFLLSTSGPLDLLSDALQKGTPPSPTMYVDTPRDSKSFVNALFLLAAQIRSRAASRPSVTPSPTRSRKPSTVPTPTTRAQCAWISDRRSMDFRRQAQRLVFSNSRQAKLLMLSNPE